MEQNIHPNKNLYKFFYYFGIFLLIIVSGFLGGFLYAYIYSKSTKKTLYLPQYPEAIKPTLLNFYDNFYTYYTEDINKNISGYGEFSVVLYNNRGISFKVLNSSGQNVTSSVDVDKAVHTRGTTPAYTAIKVPFYTNDTNKLTLQYNSGFHDIRVIRIDYISPDSYY